jgi:hypothetical protein
VTAGDLNDKAIREVYSAFYRRAINLNRVVTDPTPLLAARTVSGRIAARLVTNILGPVSWLRKPAEIRIVEKTPKNCLRLPMLEQLFPDALYVITTRRAEMVVDSLISGWHAYDRIGPMRRKRFGTYPIARELELQDYAGRWWNYALVPGWRELKGRTVAEVAAWQYYQCNRYLFADQREIDPGRVLRTTYEELTAEPRNVVSRILRWADFSETDLVGRFADEQIRPTRRALDHSGEVGKALEGIPDMAQLQATMGYD